MTDGQISGDAASAQGGGAFLSRDDSVLRVQGPAQLGKTDGDNGVYLYSGQTIAIGPDGLTAAG